ncbi:DUF998 domain-containing protein [Actinoplanes aureus]|uniref:DUF998 domain-containing protein n=1 Tax=Actinoplanes aureus TaxID=2792083 RepID=A0A931CJA9_9ACTN|nr:DUF998 domain-containing protein [Actinoplanes aureus]MBG0569042.1 DUF998 domain-containing protein [Actinoplanes aureus]
MTNRLAGAAIIAYQILLAAIILIRPEINPTHKPISEYAIGRLGWIAVLAFLLATTAYALLFAALRPLVRGRLGLSLLAICVLGTFGVGVFVADPVTTPWSAMTTVGRLHVICGLSALVLLPFAALLINRELARRLPAAARVLRWTGWLPLAGLILHALLSTVIPPEGWPPRLLFLTYAIWLLIVADVIGESRKHAGTVR